MRNTSNSQQAREAAEQLSKNDLSNKIQPISLNFKTEKASRSTSGLAMMGGLFLLTVGTIFSNTLVASGQEKIVLSLFAIGFSLIYYGVSEDNK